MTHKITPLRPHVIDAATGLHMPLEGVLREVLLPPDHHHLRTGDVAITEQVTAGAPPAIRTAEKPLKDAA